MALPFLPANHIEPAFHQLTQQTKDATLLKLIHYVKKTWITGFYQIASWCIFNQSTQTNNDVEGWHRRLNKKTDNEKPPFYLLVRRLYEEAQLLPIQRKLVSEGKLSRYYPGTKEHKLEALNQAILFNLWDQYTAGSISTTRLLNQCGRVNGNNFFLWAASWLKRGASWQWGELTWILCIHLDTGFDFQI